MKSIFKALIAVIALAIGTTACQDSYWDAYKSEGEQYSFILKQVEENFKISSALEDRELQVTIRRTTDQGESELPLEITTPGTATVVAADYYVINPTFNDDGTYTANPVAKFEDGEYSTTVKIYFIGGRRNQTITGALEFPVDLKSAGGMNAITLKCKLVN